MDDLERMQRNPSLYEGRAESARWAFALYLPNEYSLDPDFGSRRDRSAEGFDSECVNDGAFIIFQMVRSSKFLHSFGAFRTDEWAYPQTDLSLIGPIHQRIDPETDRTLVRASASLFPRT